MSPSGAEYLRHILDEAAFLSNALGRATEESFYADETLKRAVVRSLEIIGEAAKHVPEATRNTYPHIEWRAMSGIRDRLIHGYFGIDYQIVWDVAARKIPELRVEILSILASMEGSLE